MAVSPDPTTPPPLHILNEDVKFVDSFTYLEPVIATDISTKDIRSRTSKADVSCAIYQSMSSASEASASKP